MVVPRCSGWIPQPTNDGSFTFFSQEFGETFHSCEGARAEAFEKFAQATNLAEKAQQGKLRLLDVCYGLGYNTAAALEVVGRVNPNCEVEVVGLELDATVPRAAVVAPVIDGWSWPVQEVLWAIAHQHHYTSSHCTAKLLIGDARQTIQTLYQVGFQADGIFLDPFSPRRCPQLWTVEFFTLIARCLAPEGRLATYSRSASVRSAMLAAGLCIGTIPLGSKHQAHEWSQGTVANFYGEGLHPLSVMEQEHLNTRAAIPYRDRTLNDTAEVILNRHQQEQAISQAESTSSWRRRWGIK
jgi:tRNA U34 5-methylaminomethyl-2-thiouridine-forming methyltransferase MnmC